jgi:hypothetical protein
MADRHDTHGPKATEVVDPNTGQRYLMYTLPTGSWPTQPQIVYECPTCKGRFPPIEWTRGCPGCAKATADKAKSDKEKAEKDKIAREREEKESEEDERWFRRMLRWREINR